ncbi:DNA mismatch repair protein MutS [Microaceticoccus formicicus]|uniref:DNA mismatch repair protein MutS n=1 Tax=Microaceticoccus formicicus TaxID=3118105 RepID=UPI003CD048EF
MMQQYFDIKERFQDSILLFRLGDFYEMFFDDALTASKVLDIVLTKRDCGLEEKAPMCGIPHHVADVYINRLVSNGLKVALCEQIEDPSLAKGIVDRDVVRVISPGTIIDSEMFSKENNFLMCILLDELGLGISYIDISTGEVKFTELYTDKNDIVNYLENEITKVNPTEIIINEDSKLNNNIVKLLSSLQGIFLTYYKLDLKSPEDYHNKLVKYFKKSVVESKFKNKPFATISMTILLDYVYKYQKNELAHINDPIFIKPQDYLAIDARSRFNLEISQNRTDGDYSLIKVLDKTSTPMGLRMLKSWVENPLLDISKILKRQDVIDAFLEDQNLANRLDLVLKNIYDIERLIGKLSFSRANAKDLIALKLSIEHLPILRKLLMESTMKILKSHGDTIDELTDIFTLISESIIDDPPTSIKEGGMIKEGYSKELDEMRYTSIKGKERLVQYEMEQKEDTGIRSLKIVFNKKTGYFIDVTKSNSNLVPENYHKVQTLTNSERYTTNELKVIESMIFTSEEDTIILEEKIFNDIREKILLSLLRIQNVCHQIAIIDALLSLAIIAKTNNYVKPSFNNSNTINILKGRHPIIETIIGDLNFIPNDVEIGAEDNLIQIITGPNMSGKSTYLRQIALIVIMAQIGSFVPAESADLCIVDKIFTRIGASDNILFGDSTFMVEMKEMSYILQNATKKSLILLDEVGRGTSTFDGLSIAWAIVEHLASKIKSKTLFATHYQELTQLDEKLSQVKNLSVQVEEGIDGIIFLHKIIKGSSSRSFGIEVARLAGFPETITNRAKTVLKSIEKTSSFEINKNKLDSVQVDFSSYQKDAFIKSISAIDIDHISPIDALNKLSQIIDESKLIGDDLND